MGQGALEGAALTLWVAATAELRDHGIFGASVRRALWRRGLNRSAWLLHRATRGRCRVETIHIDWTGAGRDGADVVLGGPRGLSHASRGRFGQPGEHIHLTQGAGWQRPLTLVHELAHQLWGLGDEYTGPLLQARVAAVRGGWVELEDLPRHGEHTLSSVLPLGPQGLSSAELRRLRVRALWPDARGHWHSHPVLSMPGPRLLELGRPPQAGQELVLQYRSHCQPPELGGHGCIMASGGDAAGRYVLRDELEEDGAPGVWRPADRPVSDFCDEGCHDGTAASEHNLLHGGRSCWSVIAEQLAARGDLRFETPRWVPWLAGGVTRGETEREERSDDACSVF